MLNFSGASNPTAHRLTRPARGMAVRGMTGSAFAAVFTFIAATLLSVAMAPAASAADYRYWTFWTGEPQGTWTFAQKGAADITVTNEFVEGWRFTISPASGSSPQPRIASQYAELCPNPTVKSGQVGVAVVIDYGIVDEAPPGETPPASPITKCVSVPQGSSAADALAAAGVVRADKGMVCGVNGYPATECGVEVKPVPVSSESPIAGGLKPTKAPVDASGVPSAVGAQTSDLSPWPFVLTSVGIVAVVLLVSWFFLRIRRRSMPQPPSAQRAAQQQQAGQQNTPEDPQA